MKNFIEGIVPLLRHKPKMKSVVTNYVPLRHLLKANIKATRLNMLACRPAILSRASAKRLPYNLGVFITETVLDKLGADATETVLNFNIL